MAELSGQDGVIPFEIALYDLFAGQGSRCTFGIPFKEFVVHQHLSHHLDVKVGIFHLPYLAGF